MTSDKQVAYILGGGPSLLNLTDAEKAHLNQHPNTLAMNKYLMFWEMVGVVPKQMMQTDFGSPIAKIVASETLRIRQEIAPTMTYYTHPSLTRFFFKPRTLRAWLHAVRRRWRFRQQHGYWIPLNLVYDHIVYIDVAIDSDDFSFAQSLDEPLYHYRGSLTSAINLAAILFPQADIKLLGVDMNGYSAFYEMDPMPVDLPRYHRYRSYGLKKQTQHHQESRKRDIHVTAATEAGKPGVQTVIPHIRTALQQQGRDLYCCNPQSLLVVEDLCPYVPVIS